MQSYGYGAAEARVKYYGPATAMLTGRVRVQAYRTASFTGLPDAEYTLAGTDLGSAHNACGLLSMHASTDCGRAARVGLYYLRAYIDHNNNGVRDPGESWGYANYYGADAEMPYTARPVEVHYGTIAPCVDIVIEDADTDQDWVPDAWSTNRTRRVISSATLGQHRRCDRRSRIRSGGRRRISGTDSSRCSRWARRTRTATDWVTCTVSLLAGRDLASTAADGFTDGAKVALGLNPADKLSLNLDGFPRSPMASL